jgi:hypothetical protein
MQSREKLIQEIEQAPDDLVEEVLNFLLFTKTRRTQPKNKPIWGIADDIVADTLVNHLYKNTNFTFAPYLKHKGNTPDEQRQLNQAVMEKRQQWLEEDLSEEETQRREKHFERFKQIVDSNRPAGHKLYNAE